MTAAETEVVWELTLQSQDRLLHVVAHASEKELQTYIANAPEFAEYKKETKLVAQDVVPVYLAPATGRILVPFSSLDTCQQRRTGNDEKGSVVALRRGLHLPG